MTNVYFLGPENSYSHIVTKQVFVGNGYDLTPCKTFQEIVEKILREKDSIGVLPIENSITSDIHENIDALFKSNLSIIAEAYLNISLHLIGLTTTEVDDITDVYSHPRALAQCTQFIKKHGLTTHDITSTSKGLSILLEKHTRHAAIIGSSELVVSGKTKILKKDIGNDKINMTRFGCISQQGSIFNTIKNKTSIIFKVPHIPGSLAKILTDLANLHLNLTKIESRPIPGTAWEYYFWVDVEKQDLDIEKIKNLLENETTEYRILGVYTTGKVFES